MIGGVAWTTWREATERALYGERGFFRTHAPSQHFRTSVHASPVFAEAVRCLARDAGLTTVVDVGAGGGELLAALHSRDPSLELIGVDLADRPPGLPADVSWQHEVPATTGALLVANEWLDDVPVDVVELADDGWRLVLVDPATGAERLGPPPADDDADWLAMWWPRTDVGDRAEIGRPRDEAWAAAVGTPHRRAGRRDRLRARPHVAAAGRQPHRLPRRSPGAAGARRQLRRHQPRRPGRLRRSRHRRRRDRDAAHHPARGAHRARRTT